MQYLLEPVTSSKLPRLAWLGYIPKVPGTIRVLCGIGVEVADNAIVEGCWDGTYCDFDFERHGYFFGSGLKVVEDRVELVASSSLTDRVVWADGGAHYVCSNSLPMLLAATHSKLDPELNYANVCATSLKGVRRYDPTVPLLGPLSECRQVFGHTVVFKGEDVASVYRTPFTEPLETYTQYASALSGVIARVTQNSADENRKFPLKNYATLSTGYDSPAVASLMLEPGLEKVFTTKPDKIAPYLEDGTPLAKALGFEMLIMERVTPDYENELYALAGTIDGRESIFELVFRELEHHKDVSAIYTGYHGDKVWDRNTPDKYWHEDILRGDTSGLNLCEIRLKSGFVNVAVPFIFAERIEDLMRLAQSKEMKKWSVSDEYDRPLPRRIAEEAGLPRDSFGQQKKVVLSYESLPLNAELKKNFIRYFRTEHGLSKLMANELLGNFDYALKKARTALHIPYRVRPFKKRLGKYLVANQAFIFANNEIASNYTRQLTHEFQATAET